MSDKQNIGPDNNKHLPEDKLMAYLEGKLPPAEQHEVEQWLSAGGMESDAIEGLKNVSAGETKHTVSRLNHKLRRDIINSKRRYRRKPESGQFAWIAIVIVLLIIVMAYWVIRVALAK